MCIRDRPKDQSEKEIVKDGEVKQPKKMPEPTQQEDARVEVKNLQQLWELIERAFKKQNEKLDRFNEKLSETLDGTYEGIEETSNENKEPADKKIEDSRKEIKTTEDKSILLSTNKNNSHKEDIQTMKMKKVRQIHPRKLINSREELEMMKNGLLEMFNILINDQNEMMNFKNNRRNLLEPLEGNHYKIVCNRIRRRRHLIDMHNPCLLYTSRCV